MNRYAELEKAADQLKTAEGVSDILSGAADKGSDALESIKGVASSLWDNPWARYGILGAGGGLAGGAIGGALTPGDYDLDSEDKSQAYDLLMRGVPPEVVAEVMQSRQERNPSRLGSAVGGGLKGTALGALLGTGGYGAYKGIEQLTDMVGK